MKSKNLIFILVALLILVVAYFGYKGFNLYYYSNDNQKELYSKLVDSLNNEDTMTIKRERSTDYLEYKNVKIKNVFKEFKKMEQQSTDNSVKYALYDENNNVKASFWIGETDTYINNIKADKTLYGTDDKRFSNVELKSLLENNNIQNDIELFKYLKENKTADNNIFTSVKTMKKRYDIESLANIMLPSMNGITYLKGDYEGYILNIDKYKEVSILKNNKRYIFMFMNVNTSYFTSEDINSLINSVVID